MKWIYLVDCGMKYCNKKAVSIFTTVILLSLIAVKATCQTPNNRLQKYSYPVLGVDSAFAGGGTCFFIKDNGSLYLITAKHVLSGCENDSTKYEAFPDIHYVFLGSYMHSIPIDTKKLKAQLPCDGVDIIIMKISDTSQAAYINSAEQFLSPNLKEFKNIVIFGYPTTVYAKGMFKSLPKSSFMNIKESSFVFSAVMDNGKIDSLSIALNWNKGAIKESLMNGYSGSPVFLKNKENNNWRLMGLVSASKDMGKDSTSIRIIRIEAIMDKIKTHH